ncbi:hypothetical protein [Cohnella sp.]|uniref:hypothetical protein n=1 Tax=Cohnella sp. TaxID=1883426 RepID=UPI00356A9035
MYAKLVKVNDQWVRNALERQVLEPSSRYYGGVTDLFSGIARPNHVGTVNELAVWTTAIVNPDSAYYHDAGLLSAMERCADFLLNRQHGDGTISLGSTNFHSPPDTAFVIDLVSNMVRLLEQEGWPEFGQVAEKLELFLQRTLPAMLTGGCHTPNHRWVITAALALLYERFRDPALLVRADEWLAEGMDLTEDGEWTERSNGIYNAVSDMALFHAARVLQRPELLEPVRRNLRMMVYLVHPSGEVVTDYSGRQDYGHAATMANYFLICRLMAAHDQDPLFAAMADYACSFLIRSGEADSRSLPNGQAMMAYLLYPESSIDGLERAPLPQQYEKILNAGYPMKDNLRKMEGVGHHSQIHHSKMHTAFGSPLVRIRDQEDSVTIMTGAPSFFSLRHGKADLLGVKLSTSFSPGIVAFDEFAAADGEYKLAKTMEKGYYGPVHRSMLPDSRGINETSPWYLLPHQERPLTHLQQHRLEAQVSRDGEEWIFHVKSDELEDVYTQLTFIFGANGCLSGEGLEPVNGHQFFFKSGSLLYTEGQDTIEISGGAYEHWLPVLREDRHPAGNGCRYAHINLITPFERTFIVRLGTKQE